MMRKKCAISNEVQAVRMFAGIRLRQLRNRVEQRATHDADAFFFASSCAFLSACLLTGGIGGSLD